MLVLVLANELCIVAVWGKKGIAEPFEGDCILSRRITDFPDRPLVLHVARSKWEQVSRAISVRLIRLQAWAGASCSLPPTLVSCDDSGRDPGRGWTVGTDHVSTVVVAHTIFSTSTKRTTLVPFGLPRTQILPSPNDYDDALRSPLPPPRPAQLPRIALSQHNEQGPTAASRQLVLSFDRFRVRLLSSISRAFMRQAEGNRL
jgi:hypothetical protein